MRFVTPNGNRVHIASYRDYPLISTPFDSFIEIRYPRIVALCGVNIAEKDTIVSYESIGYDESNICPICKVKEEREHRTHREYFLRYNKED